MRHTLSLALTLAGAAPLPTNVILIEAPEPTRVNDEDLAADLARTVTFGQALNGAPRNREQRRQQLKDEQRKQRLLTLAQQHRGVR